EVNVAEKTLFFRGPVPSGLNSDASAVGEREGRNIDRIAEGMLGDSRAAGADHAATGIRRDLLNLSDRRPKPSHRRRLYALAHPMGERRNNGTSQSCRRRENGRCHWTVRLQSACRSERGRSALRRLVRRCLVRALRRLVDGRTIGALGGSRICGGGTGGGGARIGGEDGAQR